MINISGDILETDRLILREWKLNDLEDFYAYAKVDGVGQKCGWLPHKNIEESKGILENFIEGKHTFALVYKENNHVIGSLGLEREGDKTCELGYCLSKDYWGRGLMPEAVKRVIQFCFQVLHMEYLTCCHFVDNNQSRRVIEKCGFTYLRDGIYHTYYGVDHRHREYILYNPYLLDLSDFHEEIGALTIHSLRKEDFEDFYAIISIPGVLENAGGKVINDPNEGKICFERYSHLPALGLYQDQRLIGQVKLKEKHGGSYELGCFLHPDYWGKGIMAKAINRIVEVCFETYAIPFFSAAIFDYNIHSQKMIHKCHFRYWKKGSYYSQDQEKEITETHFIRYNTSQYQLIEVNEEYIDQCLEYKKEFIKYQEHMDGSSRLANYDDMHEWLDYIRECKAGRITDWVQSNAYLLVRVSDHQVVGMCDARFGHNAKIDSCYGYLGYSIRHTERNKGLGTIQLFLLLSEFEKVGIKDILVTALKDNTASQKVIQNNGGIYENDVIDPDDQAVIERYWIHL